ncbi:MAG: biotin-dependent carboxyltransferase [Alteromonadales bacterium]|nr:biotin-dependent carboxyltransferase [Alteromonadales bacterium]
MKQAINGAKCNLSTNKSDLGLVVTHAGVLSLIQDTGRFGAFNLGLTNGGPADLQAFYWANRLCSNELNTTAIEISIGGLALTAQIDCVIAVTGAPMPLSVNGQTKSLWRSLTIKAGDNISFGFCAQGVRCYLAIAGGFNIKSNFGSTATVCRESVGGLSGDKLAINDVLPCTPLASMKDKSTNLMLAIGDQPKYSNEVVLHTVLGYQLKHFPAVEKRMLFSSEYKVSKHWDRMGYRLQGRAVKADIEGILSEGISYGAVQIPADGQPIILLNDRQTIGGYPKIGSVISQDCAKLSQLRQGDKVRFEPISISQADNMFHLNLARFNHTKLIVCS